MKHEQDRRLDAWLDGYGTQDASSDLLERIVAQASATPQYKPHRQFFLRRWSQSWVADIAAMASIAVFGFWAGIGLMPPQAGITQTSVVQTSTTSDQAYFENVIFGPKTWEEISL